MKCFFFPKTFMGRRHQDISYMFSRDYNHPLLHPLSSRRSPPSLQLFLSACQEFPLTVRQHERSIWKCFLKGSGRCCSGGPCGSHHRAWAQNPINSQTKVHTPLSAPRRWCQMQNVIMCIRCSLKGRKLKGKWESQRPTATGGGDMY